MTNKALLEAPECCRHGHDPGPVVAQVRKGDANLIFQRCRRRKCRQLIRVEKPLNLG